MNVIHLVFGICAAIQYGLAGVGEMRDGKCELVMYGDGGGVGMPIGDHDVWIERFDEDGLIVEIDGRKYDLRRDL